MKKSYTVTIHIDVWDRKALRLAAEAQAVKEGYALADWRKERKSISDDLIMVLDPGLSPDGTGIQETTVDDGGPMEFGH